MTAPLHAPADALLRFLIEGTGVRGSLVRLTDSWQSIGARADYPPPVRCLLGETVAASALLSAHSKIDGQLSIQLKGSGALRTLFAEYRSGGSLRGIALWQDPVPAELSPRALGANALLAITIETLPPGASETTRYQGLVGLDSDRLDQALEAYFAQSEQLPTRLLLVADADQAVGLMLQQMPESRGDVDGWARVQALFETLAPAELMTTDAHTLLHRLFHEDGARILDSQALRFACTCSRQRVASVLLQLGLAEAQQAAQSQADGVAEVACELCGQRYRFDPIDITQLFAGGGSSVIEQRH